MQRVTVHGRRREMGLGGIYDVSLKDARALSDQARKLAVTGKDPIKDRLKQRLEAAKELHTLNSVAAQCFEARKAQLKDATDQQIDDLSTAIAKASMEPQLRTAMSEITGGEEFRKSGNDWPNITTVKRKRHQDRPSEPIFAKCSRAC